MGWTPARLLSTIHLKNTLLVLLTQYGRGHTGAWISMDVYERLISNYTYEHFRDRLVNVIQTELKDENRY